MTPLFLYELLGYLTWWFGAKTAEKYTPWYVDVGVAVGGAYLINRYIPRWGTRQAAVWTGRMVAKPISYAAASRAGLAVRAATWASVVNTAKYAGAIGAGYVIGAVGGTLISGAIWGDEGTQHALDFYTGKGKYGEYFDIVGNVDTIWNAYFSGNP